MSNRVVTALPEGVRKDDYVGDGVYVGTRHRKLEFPCKTKLDKDDVDIGKCSDALPDAVYVDDVRGDIYVPLSDRPGYEVWSGLATHSTQGSRRKLWESLQDKLDEEDINTLGSDHGYVEYGPEGMTRGDVRILAGTLHDVLYQNNFSANAWVDIYGDLMARVLTEPDANDFIDSEQLLRSAEFWVGRDSSLRPLAIDKLIAIARSRETATETRFQAIHQLVADFTPGVVDIVLDFGRDTVIPLEYRYRALKLFVDYFSNRDRGGVAAAIHEIGLIGYAATRNPPNVEETHVCLDALQEYYRHSSSEEAFATSQRIVEFAGMDFHGDVSVALRAAQIAYEGVFNGSGDTVILLLQRLKRARSYASEMSPSQYENYSSAVAWAVEVVWRHAGADKGLRLGENWSPEAVVPYFRTLKNIWSVDLVSHQKLYEIYQYLCKYDSSNKEAYVCEMIELSQEDAIYRGERYIRSSIVLGYNGYDNSGITAANILMTAISTSDVVETRYRAMDLLCDIVSDYEIRSYLQSSGLSVDQQLLLAKRARENYFFWWQDDYLDEYIAHLEEVIAEKSSPPTPPAEGRRVMEITE